MYHFLVVRLKIYAERMPYIRPIALTLFHQNKYYIFVLVCNILFLSHQKDQFWKSQSKKVISFQGQHFDRFVWLTKSLLSTINSLARAPRYYSNNVIFLVTSNNTKNSLSKNLTIVENFLTKISVTRQYLINVGYITTNLIYIYLIFYSTFTM